MVAVVSFWLVVAGYLGGVLAPRMYWVMAGRRCPCCEGGRLTFQGLIENPWRRLRSWWRCGQCRAELREAGWGRLEATPLAANLAENPGKVAEIEADLAA